LESITVVKGIKGKNAEDEKKQQNNITAEYLKLGKCVDFKAKADDKPDEPLASQALHEIRNN